MTEKLDFYKCEICGNIVQVFHRGDGELVCCGHPMKHIQPHGIEEEFKEKHVPVFSEGKVLVGSTPHPMVPEHHVEFIEVISDDKKHLEIKFLDLPDNPEMDLNIKNAACAVEYCNIHGMWKGENNQH